MQSLRRGSSTGELTNQRIYSVSVWRDWLMRAKKLRKPLVLVGVACTSVFSAVMVFHTFLHSRSARHVLPHSLPQPLSRLHPSSSPSLSSRKYCTTCNSSSYKTLRKHEKTIIFKDSTVKRLDVVFLGSNSPIEDRFVVGTSDSLAATFLSMIDGHKGTMCSQYLQENMLQHISGHFSAHVGGVKDDVKVVLDMGKVAEGKGREDEVWAMHGNAKGADMSAEQVMNNLRRSLAGLDDKLSQESLEVVKSLSSGVPLGNRSKVMMRAVHGACALTAMLQRGVVFVANTGDCRVVLGRKKEEEVQDREGAWHHWKPLPLSVDQNAQNPEEVVRLLAAHPRERETVIVGGRVLGSLMPFRSFGDVDLKWEKQYLKYIQAMVPLEVYKTPPYVTAEPVVTRHKLESSDKFLILATDGFWERMDGQRAVDIVGGVLALRDQGESPGSCCSMNAATELLWQSLGGTEKGVAQMLTLDPNISRFFRDDITIMVAHLE